MSFGYSGQSRCDLPSAQRPMSDGDDSAWLTKHCCLVYHVRHLYVLWRPQGWLDRAREGTNRGLLHELCVKSKAMRLLLSKTTQVALTIVALISALAVDMLKLFEAPYFVALFEYLLHQLF